LRPRQGSPWAPPQQVMGRMWRYTMFAVLIVPRLVAGQLPDGIPPEPAHDADLPALAAWIERWLPVIGAASSPTVDSTGDFYARGSDSVTGARLEGCTLVLHERFVNTVRGATTERRLAVYVPLDLVDTAAVRPKIRQARLLLSRPNVLLSGQLVVPLRSHPRTEFITVVPNDDPRSATLVGETDLPFVFAEVAAARAALALRQAVAHCAAAIER
jgi:hypothetical protein